MGWKKIEEEMENDESEEAVKIELVGKDDEKLNKLLKRLAHLEKEMKVLKSSGQERGEELDKEKYKIKRKPRDERQNNR